jgi:putative oligomerization/nucleic acid binding protein
MSRALGAIRAARAASAENAKAKTLPPGAASSVGELAKLVEMLQAGLLTREEFDQLKAEILRG